MADMHDVIFLFDVDDTLLDNDRFKSDFGARVRDEFGAVAEDRLWMLEVFYAGGTTTRDFSAADIVDEIKANGTRAEFAPSREWLVRRIAAEARDGDVVLVMGARDSSLTAFARSLLAGLETSASEV